MLLDDTIVELPQGGLQWVDIIGWQDWFITRSAHYFSLNGSHTVRLPFQTLNDIIMNQIIFSTGNPLQYKMLQLLRSPVQEDRPKHGHYNIATVIVKGPFGTRSL